MKISEEKFKNYVKQSFFAGYNGQDKESFLIEIASHFTDEQDDISESSFRVYSLDELRQSPEGSTYYSEVLGPFKFLHYNGEKIASFGKSAMLSYAGLNCTGFPWDSGVRRISAEEFEELSR